MALENFTNVSTMGEYFEVLNTSTGNYFFPVLSLTVNAVLLITAFTSPGKKANMTAPFMASFIFSVFLGLMFNVQEMFTIALAQAVFMIVGNFLTTKSDTEY